MVRKMDKGFICIMEYEQIVTLSGLIVSILFVSMTGVPVVNLVKNKLNLSGAPAFIVANCVSVLMAVIVSIAAGELNSEAINSTEAFITMVVSIAAMSEIYYKKGFSAGDSS